MVEPLRGPSVPSAFISDVLSLEDPEAAALAKALVPALRAIDPGLVPAVLQHRFLTEIQAGPRATSELLAIYRKASDDEQTRASVLDALAHILDRDPPDGQVVGALQKILGGTRSPRLASLAARALATAGEPGFLAQQRGFLASDQPSDVRLAAKLLGYGRDEGSVSALVALLNPDRGAVLDVVLWALGEIGSEDALPALHGLLDVFVQVELTCEALGKIAAPASIPRLLPFVTNADGGQRRAASEALARILTQQGPTGDETLDGRLRSQLETVLERDDRLDVRFFALLGASVLGAHVSPSRILERLGGEVDPSARAAMKTLAGRKPQPKTRGRRGRRLI